MAPSDDGVTVITTTGDAPTPAVRYTHADHALDEATQRRLAEAVPENTTRAYRVVADTFDTWCAQRGVVNLPATAATLTNYVNAMIAAEMAPATISQHIGAIRKRHSLAGHKGEPDADQAFLILRGYRRRLASDGEGPMQAPPMTKPELIRCLSALPPSTTGHRDALVLVLGFAMMARRSELAALRLADVQDTDEGMVIIVRTSKTDKESAGRRVVIPHGEDYRLDAVRHVREWRALLEGHGIRDGHLIRGITRTGAFRGGISGGLVNTIVRRAAVAAELPNGAAYTGHSLRAGGLTSALRAGIPVGVAAAHGGWSTKSPVVMQYARIADEWRDNAMRGVL